MRGRLIFAACFASTAVLASWLDLPRASRASPPQETVMGQLVGRNQHITITASPAGPRYSISRGGRLVAKDLTLDQLRAHDPIACRHVESATADGAAASWAGVEIGRD